MYSQKEKQDIAVILRLAELEEKAVQGNFNILHLKEIHRRIFQDFPKLGSDITPGQFRKPVGKNLDWVKTRQLESVNAASNVAYSNMSKDAQKKLEMMLSTIDTKKLSILKKEEFCKNIADIYIAVDYIHPFNDGNSRTLRTFTRQLAKESGYHLEWEALNKNASGRDVLYIARDISVNKISITLAQSEGTKRDITFSLDQLGSNKDMHALVKEIIHPVLEKERQQTQTKKQEPGR
ncbi:MULTISPECIES: Fic family protein [unclassified Desulfovibrio]|uniref:Fic family protein n=1 Tax=unclassified Desulfovibrio TaxID=2593640 RepID=UPI002FD93188